MSTPAALRVVVMNAPLLQVALSCTPANVTAEIHDARTDYVALFDELADDQREQLALDAWSIGLHALQHAHTSARESKLKDIGASLLADMEEQLRTHVEQQHATIASVLERFFDPRDGQVSQRLAAFVDDQGVLARLLEKYLAPKNSVLAETLARQVGETSPLFQRLSPTDSTGLVKTLEMQLKTVMGASHAELLRALDPLEQDGAVARFLRSLREELEGADKDRQKQLAAALAALDANDENSLLSRLVRDTHRAQRDVLAAINPSDPTSPMAMLASSLTKLLHEQGITQAELAKRHDERQTQFEKEIREALARIETKRAQDQKGTRAGLEFEDAVTAFVQAATNGAPCTFSVTGSTAGVGRCKKGDAVLRFTQESAFAGAAVVFEAKRDASYTVDRALAELDAARKNRDADAGVFVMARSHAGDDFPGFARYGNNVLVTWDDRDVATDTYLHAAILLGTALVSRKQQVADAGDIAALRDIEHSIEQQLTRLDRMGKHSDAIQKNVDGIGDEIRKARKALDLLLRKAESTLRALKVELSDESAERQSPIGLPTRSLEAGSGALPSTSTDA